MTLRVAINGFGRIGEMLLRTSLGSSAPIRIVAINDIVPLDQLAYLLRYDSVHTCPAVTFESGDGWLRIDSDEVRVFREREPERLPWGDLAVDVAVDCTGVFRDRDGLSRHLAAGAKRVLLSAPAKKDGVDITLCMGVNHWDYDSARHRLISNASCTTNCLAPVLRVIEEGFGLEWGMMSTVHAYTGSQSLVDTAQSKMRRGRAAAVNIVPTTTGAATAVADVLPHLAGKIDGMAFRVPVANGSVIDLVFETTRSFSPESLKAAFEKAAVDPSYAGVLDVTQEELVSSDIIGREHSAIVDTTLTLTLGDRRGKVVAWYDNEWGYASRLRDVLSHIATA